MTAATAFCSRASAIAQEGPSRCRKDLTRLPESVLKPSFVYANAPWTPARIELVLLGGGSASLAGRQVGVFPTLTLIAPFLQCTGRLAASAGETAPPRRRKAAHSRPSAGHQI